MVASSSWQPGPTWALIVVLIALSVAVDLALPADVAGAVIYLVPVLLTLLLASPRSTVATAASCAALALLPVVLRPESLGHAHAVANRVLALFAIGVTATGVVVQKRTAARLERARAEREQALSLARLGEMAAVVAHEVKNPLSGISATIQVVEGRFEPDSREARALAGARARIVDLDAELTEMLAFAHPASPQPTEVDLRELCEEVAASIATVPAFASLELSVEGDRGHRVWGDPAQLRAALLNVAVNGAQACGGRGELALRVVQHASMVEVDVRDSGDGMDPDTAVRAFDPFFTTRTRGAGLGLPIVQRTVAAHGGTVSVQSSPGSGTTVRLRLPARGNGRVSP